MNLKIRSSGVHCLIDLGFAWNWYWS